MPSFSNTTFRFANGNGQVVNAYTDDHTLDRYDNGAVVLVTKATAVHVTVPNSLPLDFWCVVVQGGAGAVTLVASSTTLNNVTGSLTTRAQNSVVIVRHTPINNYTPDTFTVTGDLETSQTISAAGALSILRNYSKLEVAGGGAITLAAPSAAMLGQLKTIEMTIDTGDVTLALTNVVGGTATTTATFSAIGQTLVLQALSTKWVVIKQFGLVLT